MDLKPQHFSWELPPIESPVLFFSSLPLLIPADSLITIEEVAMVRKLKTYLVSHATNTPGFVRRQTFYPISKLHTISATPLNLKQFSELNLNEILPQTGDRIVVTHGEDLLLLWHDAFTNWLLVSSKVTEDKVAAFAQETGVKYSKSLEVATLSFR